MMVRRMVKRALSVLYPPCVCDSAIGISRIFSVTWRAVSEKDIFDDGGAVEDIFRSVLVWGRGVAREGTVGWVR